MLTVIPDLVMVWRVQAQLVSDLHWLYGKEAILTRESMIYCLFRHASAQALRDIAVRVGERIVVKRVNLRFLQKAAQRLGVVVTQRVISRTFSRWLPLLGAAAISAYAHYDTRKVGETTLAWLASGVLEGEVEEHQVS